MLEVRIGGVVCRFSLLFPAMVAVAVTLDPSVFSLWCLAASLMHEMGHLIALLAFDCKPKRMVLGLFGMRVEQDPARRLGYRQNALVSLAGPAVNLVTFCILSCFRGNETAALVHLTLGVFNLLPIPPLDGSKVLFAVLPNKYYNFILKYERYGMIILVLLLFTDVLPYIMTPCSKMIMP